MLRKTLSFAGALCLLLAPAAGAQPGESWSEGAPQWSSVNICSPGQVGVRASLPGDGSGDQMSARFTLQWLNPGTQAWEPVQGAATSHWVDAGSAKVLWSQVGYTFQVDPTPAGKTFTFRGLAELRAGGGRQVALTTPNTCALGG